MTELKPLSALTGPSSELVQKALAVRGLAHAPYSKFHVGAALRDDRGRIYCGCNVENASYGATICAERSAICQMVAEGGRKLTEIAVVTLSPEAFFPCGLCLQVLQEFCHDARVIAVGGQGTHFREAKLSELYPSAFSKETWHP